MSQVSYMYLTMMCENFREKIITDDHTESDKQQEALERDCNGLGK